ncbi:hypothetical protein CBS9595_002864 [Malassezia furfur]|nr:hypothetical protein CBS9595_002864 [Malassezia furfur]
MSGAPPEGGVAVTIAPRQPYVFAGEEFECVITFTNTHAPRTDAPRAARAPRRVVSFADAPATHQDAGGPARRHRVAAHVAHTAPPAPHARRHRPFASRSEAWPAARASRLPSTHPHARQKSVVEWQVEDLSRAFQLHGPGEAGAAADDAPAPVPAPAPALPDRSPVPDEFASQSAGVDVALRDSLTTWSREQGAPAARAVQSPLYPDVLPEGHEKLVWAFAQFGGTMELDAALVRPAEFDRLRARLARGELAPSAPATPATPATPDAPTPRLVGGGELAYDTEIEAQPLALDTGESASHLRAEHAPSVATLAAVLFRLARPPTPQLSSAPHGPRHHTRTGSTLLDLRTKALLSRTLPTYSTPPTVLGIDVVLAPGASRSCTSPA